MTARAGIAPDSLVTRFVEPSEWKGMESEWTDLLCHSDANTFFLSWPWLWRWWESYGRGNPLRLITIRARDGRLVAVGPLYLRPPSSKGVRWGSELAFLGTGEVKSDYLDFIVRPDEAEAWRVALVESVLSSPGWDVLRLEGIPEGSGTLGVLGAALRRHGFPFRMEMEDICPYLSLPGNGGRSLELIGKKFRSDIRHQRRGLERLGKLEFVVVTDPKDLPAAIEAFAELNRSRLTTKGIRGGFRSEQFTTLLQTVGRDLFAAGQLRLCLLLVESKPIAGLWIFAYAGKYLYYQSGLDQDLAWSRHSPGTIILSFAIDQAILEGMTEFDFLRGQEAYKSRWTKDVRRLVRSTAYRRTPAGLLARASDEAWGVARRLLRRRADHRWRNTG